MHDIGAPILRSALPAAYGIDEHLSGFALGFKLDYILKIF